MNEDVGTPAPQEPATAPKPKPTQKQVARTDDPKLHCPNCRAAEIVHAKPHCPNSPRCQWRRCQCGTTWDMTTGRQYPPLQG